MKILGSGILFYLPFHIRLQNDFLFHNGCILSIKLRRSQYSCIDDSYIYFSLKVRISYLNLSAIYNIIVRSSCNVFACLYNFPYLCVRVKNQHWTAFWKYSTIPVHSIAYHCIDMDKYFLDVTGRISRFHLYKIPLLIM